MSGRWQYVWQCRSLQRGCGMRGRAGQFAGARRADSPPCSLRHFRCKPSALLIPVSDRGRAARSGSAPTGPVPAAVPRCCCDVLAVYSRCAHDALPLYASPRIGTPAQRLSRRVPAAGCIRPDSGAIGRQACQESTADGVNGQHSGLRSSADGVSEGEAASVRMGGVKRGVAQPQVGTAFSLGDRAEPLGTARTRIFIV